MGGYIHESHGPNRIGVEERNESFYIHPGYGYDPEGTEKDDSVTIGGERVKREGLARHWRKEPHPEFVLDDVPFLIRALADLETCPPIIKAGISLYFDAPDLLAPTTTTWEELLGGESALLVRLGRLVFVWAEATPTIKVVRVEPVEEVAVATEEDLELKVVLEIDVPEGLDPKDSEGFGNLCREFVGAEGSSITPEEAEGLFACYSGGQVDAELLNAVTPKLEAIAGKELAP